MEGFCFILMELWKLVIVSGFFFIFFSELHLSSEKLQRVTVFRGGGIKVYLSLDCSHHIPYFSSGSFTHVDCFSDSTIIFFNPVNLLSHLSATQTVLGGLCSYNL